MKSAASHAYIAGPIVATVCSQLVIRWEVAQTGPLPDAFPDKLSFVFGLVRRPWILTALVAISVAGVSWMLAMTKAELSYAYPFVNLNFALVAREGA